MEGAGPRRRLSDAWQLLLRELSAFGTVGAFCFVLDLALFQLLYAVLGAGAVTAKLVAALVSATVAFLGHRFWSFSRRARTGLRREYLLFSMVNGSTLLLSLGIVAFVRYPLGQESALVLQIANVGAIGLGTLVRWVTYRRWVFPAVGSRRTAGGPVEARVPAARADVGVAAVEPSAL